MPGYMRDLSILECYVGGGWGGWGAVLESLADIQERLYTWIFFFFLPNICSLSKEMTQKI